MPHPWLGIGSLLHTQTRNQSHSRKYPVVELGTYGDGSNLIKRNKPGVLVLVRRHLPRELFIELGLLRGTTPIDVQERLASLEEDAEELAANLEHMDYILDNEGDLLSLQDKAEVFMQWIADHQ